MSQTKTSFSKIVFWLLLLVFVWIAVTYFAKTEQILEVLLSGRWYWMILAILCQIFYYPFYSYFIHLIFNIFRVNLGTKKILPVYIASKFTDVALPISTLGMVAIFIRNGRRHDISPLNAGIGISFVMFFDLAAFAAISSIILIFLLIFNAPALYLITTFLVLLILIFTAIIFLFRLTKSKEPISGLFLSIIRLLARLIGKKPIPDADIQNIFYEIGRDLKENKNKIWLGFRSAIYNHLVNIATLAFIFIAFTGHFNILAILAGYLSCLLFTIISITPQGIGVAEAAMIATLHSFNLSVSEAAVITLAFRGLLYWLPLFAGFYFFSKLELKKAD